MTSIEIADYDDFAGDQVLRSRGRDAVLEAFESGSTAVLWLEEWLVSEKSFEPIEPEGPLEQLVAGSLVAETESAYLFTELVGERDPNADAPGTDWVPKSQTRVYLSGVDHGDQDDDVDEVPQRGLGDYL